MHGVTQTAAHIAAIWRVVQLVQCGWGSCGLEILKCDRPTLKNRFKSRRIKCWLLENIHGAVVLDRLLLWTVPRQPKCFCF